MTGGVGIEGRITDRRGEQAAALVAALYGAHRAGREPLDRTAIAALAALLLALPADGWPAAWRALIAAARAWVAQVSTGVWRSFGRADLISAALETPPGRHWGWQDRKDVA